MEPFAGVQPLAGLQITSWGAPIPVHVAGWAAGVPGGLGAGTTAEHLLPDRSKTELQPTSRSPFGPTARPAGWQKFIRYVFSATPLVLICATAPVGPVPFPGPLTSGIEQKN